MIYKIILLAIDGSNGSNAAVEQIIKLAAVLSPFLRRCC